MDLGQLFEVFRRARQLSGHSDYVVIGSLSVLGVEEGGSVPADMTLSIVIDGYTLADPGRVFDLREDLGEDSAFHAAHGYYLDPVSPHLPTLPEGWEQRLHRVQREGLQLWFLDAEDAAISKYARCEPRDLRWVRAGILSGLVSLPTVRSRLRSTTFLDAEEEERARMQIAADTVWFEGIKIGRALAANDGEG